jgi:hypothetical protein
MRLWSLHPSLLDAKGLVALWREALLAQKVLQGGTTGSRFHPQLQRQLRQRDLSEQQRRWWQWQRSSGLGMAVHQLANAQLQKGIATTN